MPFLLDKEGIKLGLKGGLFASLCCVTPMAIFAFGLGSLSFALSFSKYKPVFLGLSVIFVLIGLVVNLRKEGTVCSIDKNKLKKKKAFIVTTIVMMVIFYYIVQKWVFPILGRIVYA